LVLVRKNDVWRIYEKRGRSGKVKWVKSGKGEKWKR
jgi:hypothetical protein